MKSHSLTHRSRTSQSSLALALCLGLLVSAVAAGCGGSGSSNSGGGGGNNPPTPAITSISPTSVVAGSGSVTLTVNGTGFTQTSVVQVNGSTENTTYVSSIKLNALIPAAQIASVGQLPVVVLNGMVSSGSGTPMNFEVDNPAPSITSVSPASEVTGATGPVIVNGTGFVAATVINVNGAARTTTYINATQVSVALTSSDVAAPTALSLTAVNPPPGGGTSGAATLVIASPMPTPLITLVDPTQILAGSPDTQINVQGIGFTTNTVVNWNGAPLVTTGFTSSSGGSTITAIVPAADLATMGTASVTVSTPTANPSTSNAVIVTIFVYPLPNITGISPVMVPINTAIPQLTVNGSGFTRASVISISGTALDTSYISASTLSATVPASLAQLPGVFAVTVTTPAPGGGTSTPQYLTAYVPIANNSMVYNPVNGLFYLSVPSAAGTPYGNSVVSIDPLTGVLGTPIPVGSEPNRMALTADGRFIWVALDGGASIRKVDLTTGTAGMQFPISSGGDTVAALAALPSATNSVVVSTYYGGYTVPTGVNLAIYDSGVARSSVINFSTYATFPWALIVDGTKNEIYGPGNGTPQTYNTYAYDATGLTLKSSTYSNLSYAENDTDDAQIVQGRLYTDYGQVDDPESGALLGSFYSAGTTPAQGSIAIDSSLGLAFILEGYWGSNSYQLQAFNLSDSSATAAPPISVYNPTFRASYQYAGPTGNRLTRWGSDGLAFRSTGGFVSLRTSMVRDLSQTNADLAVTLASSGANSTGTATTYTATITNNGPAPASNVALVATIPLTGKLTSVSSSAGSCTVTSTVTCNLGNLNNGSSNTVIFTVQQVSPGTAVMSVQVSASENDPTPANNLASSSLTIAGVQFNLVPALAAISPQAIQTGSSDTTITVTGSNFSPGSVALLNGNPLVTTFNSSTELQVTVPAENLAGMGWAAISVSSPLPGGGTSSALPLTIFSTIALGANHIVYDSYSQKIMASVSTGSSTISGNSIVAIDPSTGSVGTPVSAGGTPTVLSLASDGQILYALVPGATTGTILRYNMLTQQSDFSVSGFEPTGYNTGLRDLAALPGAENTVAVDEGEYPGISIFDFDPIAKTATRRGQATGTYTGTCLAFPSANNLLALDLYSSPSEIEEYTVTTNGLVNGSYPYAVGSVIQNQNCYKISGDLLVTEDGGVASTSTIPLTQLGAVEGLPSRSNYAAGVKDFEADASLGMAYFLTDSQSNNTLYSPAFDTISGYALNVFMPVTSLAMPFAAIEGAQAVSGLDVVRWGQDGLAVLTSGGHIYFLRGPVVLPELLDTNTSAVLTSSSLQTIAHGSGNLLLTLTGSNFVAGVAVTWNGSYRTTTIIDATHISVAIPASDLTAAGIVAVIATNPGASVSNALTITIN